jgi:hypothetical protein
MLGMKSAFGPRTRALVLLAVHVIRLRNRELALNLKAPGFANMRPVFACQGYDPESKTISKVKQFDKNAAQVLLETIDGSLDRN